MSILELLEPVHGSLIVNAYKELTSAVSPEEKKARNFLDRFLSDKNEGLHPGSQGMGAEVIRKISDFGSGYKGPNPWLNPEYNEAQDIPRLELLRASKIGLQEQELYKYLTRKDPEVSEYVTATASAGSALHLLREAQYLKSGKARDTEGLLYDPKEKISGHTDITLKTGEILDIKTVSGEKFKEVLANGAFEKNVRQLNWYMKQENASRGILEYYNRDTGEVKQIPISFNERMYQEDIAKIRRVRARIQEELKSGKLRYEGLPKTASIQTLRESEEPPIRSESSLREIVKEEMAYLWSVSSRVMERTHGPGKCAYNQREGLHPYSQGLGARSIRSHSDFGSGYLGKYSDKRIDYVMHEQHRSNVGNMLGKTLAESTGIDPESYVTLYSGTNALSAHGISGKKNLGRKSLRDLGFLRRLDVVQFHKDKPFLAYERYASGLSDYAISSSSLSEEDRLLAKTPAVLRTRIKAKFVGLQNITDEYYVPSVFMSHGEHTVLTGEDILKEVPGVDRLKETLDINSLEEKMRARFKQKSENVMGFGADSVVKESQRQVATQVLPETNSVFDRFEKQMAKESAATQARIAKVNKILATKTLITEESIARESAEWATERTKIIAEGKTKAKLLIGAGVAGIGLLAFLCRDNKIEGLHPDTSVNLKGNKFSAMPNSGTFAAEIRGQLTEFKKDFASRWDLFKNTAAKLLGESESSVMAVLRKHEGFQKALQEAVHVGELGSGATGTVSRMRAKFMGHEFEFARKVGLIPENEVAAMHAIEGSVGPSVYSSKMGQIDMELFRGRKLTETDIALNPFIEEDITKAYKELHGTGWLHRDPNLGNVMLLENGQIGLIDMGAARRAETFGSVSEVADEMAHEISVVTGRAESKFTSKMSSPSPAIKEEWDFGNLVSSNKQEGIHPGADNTLGAFSIRDHSDFGSGW